MAALLHMKCNATMQRLHYALHMLTHNNGLGDSHMPGKNARKLNCIANCLGPIGAIQETLMQEGVKGARPVLPCMRII